MPTGYTAGILNGEIKDFKKFAMLCMRAFGATIHMRDDELDKPFEPRTPSNYHTEEIEKCKKTIADAESCTDEEIVSIRKGELLIDMKHSEDAINKAKSDLLRLVEILNCAKEYEPPTQEHFEIKKFMIDQIEKTIDFDCSTEYYEMRLVEIENELKSLNAQNVRAKIKAKAYKDLAYHTEQLNEEITRCDKSNKWVEQFLASLPNSITERTSE